MMANQRSESTGIQTPLRVAVVGPCSSGKSTLAELVRSAGIEIRQPAQEHSLVPDMWQRITRPDVLIYLDVSYEEARRRRPFIDGGRERLARQHAQLRHARENCDYYLDTSGLTPEQVHSKVMSFLDAWQTD